MTFHRSRILFLLSLVTLHSLLPALNAALVEHTLTISRATVAPDCFPTNVVVVNGQIPGPAIIAQEGDTLRINVINNLPPSKNPGEVFFSMHWHGILQKNTPWADGTPGVTESPIAPGNKRSYQFEVTEAGTYYYHAHSRFHAVTAHGALVVQKNEEKRRLAYDEDKIFVLSEYFHQSLEELLSTGEHDEGTLSMQKPVNFGDALLVNGNAISPMGQPFQQCPNATAPGCDAKLNCRMHVVEVEAGKTYRFRFINAGNKVPVRLNFPGDHEVSLIELDSSLVESTAYNKESSKKFDLLIGQRVSFLFKATKAPRDYYVTLGVDGVSDLRTTFVIRYKGATSATTTTTAETIEKDLVYFNETVSSELSLKPASDGGASLSAISNRTIVLEVSSNNEAYQINAKSFHLPSFEEPFLLKQLYRGNQTTSQDNIYPLKVGEVVDLVIQLGPNFLGTHPWHLHGHRFLDMGGGAGRYDASNATLLNTPVYRDTVSVRSVFTSDTTKGSGWRVLRLKVDNPGIWHMHCHIHDHMLLGMQIALSVSPERLPALPTTEMMIEYFPSVHSSSPRVEIGATLMSVMAMVVAVVVAVGTQ